VVRNLKLESEQVTFCTSLHCLSSDWSSHTMGSPCLRIFVSFLERLLI